MLPIVEQKRAELAELCRRYGVRQLDLFGSATRPERFDAGRSDLDFLVQFAETEAMNPADQYFGLLEDLQRLFGREVDLVSARGLRNPYFIKSIHATREPLYAA